MTRQTFMLPDLGEGLTEADLVRWLVQVGDTVAIDAPVAEVETAKAVVEVPSPYGGVVAELHGAEGTTIQVGAPLISVTPATEKVSVPDAQPAAADATYREEERAGSGNVLIGYGTSAGTSGSHRRHRPRMNRSLPKSEREERPRVQSPLVRKLARDRGIDIQSVTGTGPDGLITRTDVEKASLVTAAAPAVPSSAPAISGQGTDSRTGLGFSERIPLRGIRKTIANTLSRSRREIPEATTWVDVDATKLLELRASLKSESDPGPGLLALIARFVVAGLTRFPVLNARVDTESEEIQVYDGINLGIATQTDRGLIVPAVRDAHRLSARGLDREIRRLAAAAREGRTGPGDLGHGTFTLNNYGPLGTDGSAAIINYPEVAILGMGRIIPRPWVVDGQIVPRDITQLSLVFDHRVCDGGTASGFIRFVADAIESPMSSIADL